MLGTINLRCFLILCTFPSSNSRLNIVEKPLHRFPHKIPMKWNVRLLLLHFAKKFHWISAHQINCNITPNFYRPFRHYFNLRLSLSLRSRRVAPKPYVRKSGHLCNSHNWAVKKVWLFTNVKLKVVHLIQSLSCKYFAITCFKLSVLN